MQTVQRGGLRQLLPYLSVYAVHRVRAPRQSLSVLVPMHRLSQRVGLPIGEGLSPEIGVVLLVRILVCE